MSNKRIRKKKAKREMEKLRAYLSSNFLAYLQNGRRRTRMGLRETEFIRGIKVDSIIMDEPVYVGEFPSRVDIPVTPKIDE